MGIATIFAGVAWFAQTVPFRGRKTRQYIETGFILPFVIFPKLSHSFANLSKFLHTLSTFRILIFSQALLNHQSRCLETDFKPVFFIDKEEEINVPNPSIRPCAGQKFMTSRWKKKIILPQQPRKQTMRQSYSNSKYCKINDHKNFL